MGTLLFISVIKMAVYVLFVIIQYSMCEGNGGYLQEFQLLNPEEKSDDGFIRSSTNTYKIVNEDIKKVCMVKLRLVGDDGWRVQQVIVWKTKDKESTMSIFIFDSNLDDSSKATRAIQVHGQWSEWTPWPQYINQCGVTWTLFRYRFCNNPKPGCAGNYCSGNYSENRTFTGPVCTTTTTSTSSTTKISPTSKFTSTSTTFLSTVSSKALDRAEKNRQRVIILGVLHGLSLLLIVVLAVFLFVVLQDQKRECINQEEATHSPLSDDTQSPVYVNQ